jgi:NitT/TauT family transport system substrate-binding protein
MRITFPRFVMLISLALSAFAVEADPKPVYIGALKGPSGIGMARLFETPPTLPDGSAVRLVAVPSADLMTAKLISGEYDAGVLPVNVAAKLYTAGIPLRLAAIVGDGMVSFLSSDPSVSSLVDLKGKKVNVAGQGATPDFLLRLLLKSAGLDPESDLRLDYSLPYPEAAAALAAGKISYAVLPEPFATMATLANPALRPALDLGALWTKETGQASYPMTAFVVSAKLAERPGTVAAILDAYAASIRWVVAEPKQAGALVERQDLGLTASIAAKAIPRSAYVFTPAIPAKQAIEALLRAFLEFSPLSVGGKLPDDGFYLTN